MHSMAPGRTVDSQSFVGSGYARRMREPDREETTTASVALITGAAVRVGAAIAETLHARGFRVVVHCHRSTAEAEALTERLNARRADSAVWLSADLADLAAVSDLALQARRQWGRLNVLVNNASSYRRTPLGQITPADMDDLLTSNLRAPLMLAQACAAFSELGQIINILDVYARKPRPGYAPYFAAKAGLWTLTEALAVELAPRVRVNGVAPGHMIWAVDSAMNEAQKQAEAARIPLGRLGGADEVARAVAFLASDEAAYMTGAVLPVDGGLRFG